MIMIIKVTSLFRKIKVLVTFEAYPTNQIVKSCSYHNIGEIPEAFINGSSISVSILIVFYVFSPTPAQTPVSTPVEVFV